MKNHVTEESERLRGEMVRTSCHHLRSMTSSGTLSPLLPGHIATARPELAWLQTEYRPLAPIGLAYFSWYRQDRGAATG
jgi:hypothetical protein